jgi:glycosyltransferase involved in cell wall biosynthesis
LFFEILSLRKNFDLINSIDLDTILPTYFCSGLLKKSLVFDSHEYFTEVPELIGRNTIRKIWDTIGNFTLSGVKYNYTVNDSLAKIFTKKYNQVYSVIRNVPENVVEPSIPVERNKILVYLGVLNKGRGIEIAVKSLIELKGYELWLLGKGDLEGQIRALVVKLKLQSRVRFFDWVKPNAIHDILKQARIGINILEPLSESYRLSLANKFFDYMHAGIPSINSELPEYRAILDNYHCGLVSEVSPSALSEIIRKVSEDERLYLTLTNHAETAKHHFHWEKEAERLVDKVNAVLRSDLKN